MNTQSQLSREKKLNKYVVAVSIIIPIAVGFLFRDRYITGVDFSFLPPIYATINGCTAILLIAALWAIKNKKVKLHENLIKTALLFSLLFLVMYVLYHISSETTVYGGEGVIKYVYYFFLISHVLLSMIIIPFVLFSYTRAITQQFERHKKIARIAFPMWLYVAVTGVIVYAMISPYY